MAIRFVLSCHICAVEIRVEAATAEGARWKAGMVGWTLSVHNSGPVDLCRTCTEVEVVQRQQVPSGASPEIRARVVGLYRDEGLTVRRVRDVLRADGVVLTVSAIGWILDAEGVSRKRSPCRQKQPSGWWVQELRGNSPGQSEGCGE